MNAILDTIDSLVHEVSTSESRFEKLSSDKFHDLIENRQKLLYLQTEVLPRRKACLIQILDDKKMPNGIQNFFVNRQIQLIKNVAHEIFQLSIYNQTLSREIWKQSF